MSQSENPASKPPTEEANERVRCVGNCGFWGDASTKNYCSVCFKKLFPDDAVKVQQAKAAAAAASPPDDDQSKDTESKEDDAAPAEPEQSHKPKKKVQKKKNRCWATGCRKKLTLAGQFQCKCGYTFCAKHRYPDKHECDVDHKKQHKE